MKKAILIFLLLGLIVAGVLVFSEKEKVEEDTSFKAYKEKTENDFQEYKKSQYGEVEEVEEVEEIEEEKVTEEIVVKEEKTTVEVIQEIFVAEEPTEEVYKEKADDNFQEHKAKEESDFEKFKNGSN